MNLTFMRMSAVLVLSLTSTARADGADILSNYVGYTVIAVKTVESFADRGKDKKDGFEVCDYSRVIVFTDGTAVTCNSYSFWRRPSAVAKLDVIWEMQ